MLTIIQFIHPSSYLPFFFLIKKDSCNGNLHIAIVFLQWNVLFFFPLLHLIWVNSCVAHVCSWWQITSVVIADAKLTFLFGGSWDLLATLLWLLHTETSGLILEPPEGRKSRIPGGNIRIYLISGKINLKKERIWWKIARKPKIYTKLGFFCSIRSGSFCSFQ